MFDGVVPLEERRNLVIEHEVGLGIGKCALDCVEDAGGEDGIANLAGGLCRDLLFSMWSSGGRCRLA